MICFPRKKLNLYYCVISSIFLLTILFGDVSFVEGKIDCRKYVRVPMCRGVAAKRDIDDYRFRSSTDAGDYFVDINENPPSNIFVKIRSLLDEIKKTISKNLDNMETTTDLIQI